MMRKGKQDNSNNSKRTSLSPKRHRQWLLRQMACHRGMILVVALLGLAATVVKIGSTVASKYLIDALTGHDAQMLWTAATLTAAMMLIAMVLQGVSSHLGAKLHIRVQHRLQGQLFGKLLGADWLSLNAYPGGDLLNRLNADIGAVANGIIGLLPGLLLSGARVAGVVGILLYMDPVSAWVALVGMPVTLLVSRLLMRKMRAHDLSNKELTSGLMSFQEDALRHLTEIKTMNACEIYQGKFNRLQTAYAQANLSYHGFRIRMTACLSLLNLAVTAVCLCWGVYRLWDGSMTYGSLVLLVQLVSMLRGSLSSLLTLYQQTVTVLTSVGRVTELLELPEEDRAVPSGFSPAADWTISLRQVSCGYQAGSPVLEHFDFSASPGDLIGITGSSGIGKTTLLRMLLGLMAPSSGEALLIGQDGRQYPITAGTRGAFAYVPQSNGIFAGTVAENLRIAAPDASDDDLWKALETACAAEFLAQQPQGLEYPLTSGGRNLSQGQCQRLAIARAILRAAPILLLDEATSGLDEETERRLLENLRRSHQVRTCILVTHRQSVAACCDRVYEIGEAAVCEV